MAIGHVLLTAEVDPVHRDRQPRRQGAHGDMSAQSVPLQGGIMAKEYPWNTLLAQEHCGMPEPDQGSPRMTTGVHSPPLSVAVTRYKPTVSLGVTSAVVSSCGHDSGQIEQRVAQ
jgi:hypothetical protein